ncbi:hypothetical protein PLICRDRAFT_34775 [Plicaturopsis crispa FD-325 SS-3]|nr:hypothetical protein PLICRDRAFT_34775 [Plicaturopsis crispa FD-325 SS-3]
MSAMQIAWISIDSNNEVWVLRNKYTSKFHFDTRLNRNIYEHLAGTNGKVKAKFVSFPVEKDPQWFIKLDNRGGWTAHMEQRYIDAANGLRKTVPNFDLGLTGILFGHEGSHIYQFERGFAYHLLGDSAEEDSLLRKTLEEFLDHNDPWCIQEGSTLCFYDSRYFFLQFKRPSGSQIQQRWCLPDTMAAKMTELVRLSETPEEREAMAAGEQAALAAAIARANLVHAKGAAVNRVLAAGQWY